MTDKAADLVFDRTCIIPPLVCPEIWDPNLATTIRAILVYDSTSVGFKLKYVQQVKFVYETHLKVKLSLLWARSAILRAVRLLLLLLLLFLLAYIFLVGGTVIMAAQKFLCVRGSSVTTICWHHWK
jgi:hypothetical protein